MKWMFSRTWIAPSATVGVVVFAIIALSHFPKHSGQWWWAAVLYGVGITYGYLSGWSYGTSDVRRFPEQYGLDRHRQTRDELKAELDKWFAKEDHK